MEETLVILKPDAVQRELELPIMSFFLHKDLTTDYWQPQLATVDQVRQHYAKAIRKYGQKLEQWSIDYFLSGPVVIGILSGEDAIARVRALCGEDMDPSKCSLNTIRGHWGIDSFVIAIAEGGGEQRRGLRNLIHSSSSREEYSYERGIWVPS
jgi:nucleoside-diphosphate kinase